MYHFWEIIVNAYRDYANYLWHDITQPQWSSYFYALILVSLVFFVLEVVVPWRRNQAVLRKDFFLDLFYMFFNFFLFSLVVYNAASSVVVDIINNGISWLTGGFDLQASNPMRFWPLWAVLLLGFFVRDFIQWWVHRLLHRSDFLWRFHQVHHSVQEMGFAAHLRYHWMETVVYRTIEYLPLALLGIGLYDFFIIHLFSLAWGHYNHANIRPPSWITGGIVAGLVGLAMGSGSFDFAVVADPNWLTTLAGGLIGFGAGAVLLGPVMRIIFNSPEMHLWHHAKSLPEERRYGVNFGLTLAIWDYIFGTNYQPYDDAELELGFEGVEKFPAGFVGQSVGVPPLMGDDD
ncbi:sterol desaturase family protein [Neolewinella aurantiaca]|uniref:Sterol desaturase family protein n=1 Tax=Neolewinella aurantiaca TaxID=2602767 RepID=A0A5C7FXR6_9BACT|nr:sterol desaturase family protein [Neolewinella aurantiaca]TXF91259.1 sterol desaturase family protein [Neolewinella aurantiaca]